MRANKAFVKAATSHYENDGKSFQQHCAPQHAHNLEYASSRVLVIDICTHQVAINVVQEAMHCTFYEGFVVPPVSQSQNHTISADLAV